jgi:hypothetical protein
VAYGRRALHRADRERAHPLGLISVEQITTGRFCRGWAWRAARRTADGGSGAAAGQATRRRLELYRRMLLIRVR